jgi:hypothetical protein
MKRVLLSIIIVAVCFSCNNRGTNNLDKSNQTIEDSIKQLVLIRQQDSIERERIFAALGDTVFGQICYGVSLEKYLVAINEFCKPLNKGKDYDFCLVGCNFKIKHAINVEDRVLYRNISELESIRNEKSSETLFFNKKLSSVCWYSTDISSSSSSGGAKKMLDLISLFENKYGEPNIKKPFEFSGVVAEWQTDSRKITFNYIFSSSQLIISFLNKEYKREIDLYIDEVLKKEKERRLTTQMQDSINNANAL